MCAVALAAPPPLAADAVEAEPGECIRIERVTAFAPRGEVYVELQASCGEGDFLDGAPVVAYLELLIGDLPPDGEDVRVYPDDPRARRTRVFQDVSFASGDSILVRLVRFGKILALQSVKAP